LCTSLAATGSAAALVRGRKFLAWVSEAAPASTWPASRMVHGMGPYVRSDGQTIAANWVQFAGIAHLAPIDHDETGFQVVTANVWTGTGRAGSGVAGQCGSTWVSSLAGVGGTVGIIGSTSASWTQNETIPCNNPGHIYCVEQ